MMDYVWPVVGPAVLVGAYLIDRWRRRRYERKQLARRSGAGPYR